MSNIFGSPPAQVNTVITNDLIVGDNITATSETLSGALTALSVDGHIITDLISGKTTNADLAINPTGTGNVTSTASIQTSKNINIPTTSSTAGKIVQNGVTQFHTFGTANNVFIGPTSGNLTNTSSGNVGIGLGTLNGITSGNFNVAIGNNAIKSNTSGSFNIGLGQNSLASASMTGAENMAIGASSCLKVTSGVRNTAVGNGSLLNTLTGFGNTAIGYLAGQSLNGAEQFNTYVGYNTSGTAGESNTTRIGFPGAIANYNYGITGANIGTNANIVGCTTGSRLGTTVTQLDTTAVINTDNSYKIQNNTVHDLGAMYVYNGSLFATIQNGGTQSAFLLPAKPSSTYTLATYDDIILAYISYFSTSLNDVTTVTGGVDTLVNAPSLSATIAELNFKYLGNTEIKYLGNDTIYAEIVGSVSFSVPDLSQNDITVKLMQDDTTQIGGEIVSAINGFIVTVTIKAIVKFGLDTRFQLYYNATNSTDITTKSASIVANNI
jgi:hypothetical protein